MDSGWASGAGWLWTGMALACSSKLNGYAGCQDRLKAGGCLHGRSTGQDAARTAQAGSIACPVHGSKTSGSPVGGTKDPSWRWTRSCSVTGFPRAILRLQQQVDAGCQVAALRVQHSSMPATFPRSVPLQLAEAGCWVAPQQQASHAPPPSKRQERLVQKTVVHNMYMRNSSWM